jgi:hypothetical protein
MKKYGIRAMKMWISARRLGSYRMVLEQEINGKLCSPKIPCILNGV